MVKYLSMSGIRWKKRSAKAMRRGRGRGGRRRIRERRGDLVAPEIPFDLMIEILRRLPAKSLMRFRCVSKRWSRLIHSRYFSNLYFKSASSRPPRIYMSWVENNTGDYSVELCEIPRELQLISLRLSSSSSNSAESSLEPELTFPGIGGHKMVVLRGLILFSLRRKAYIYNPTTRQGVTLPAVKSKILAQTEAKPKYVLYFFGHDPVLDHYKIVCTIVIHHRDPEKIASEHWVFVLEPGGFWKKVEYDDDQPHMPTRQGICINGVIYYLAFTHTCRDIVYCFDVRSEKFNKILAPHEVRQFGDAVGLIEHGGKPALLDYTHIRTGVSELWVLEVDGGTWSNKSLDLKPCQRHLVDNIIVPRNLRVYGTGPNDEVILALVWPQYLLFYDLIKNDLRKIQINREIAALEHLYVYVKVMDKGESIMHLEA